MPIAERVEPDGIEIEDENDREEAVAEHPKGSHREQQAPVTVQAAQARDQARIRAGGGHIGESRCPPTVATVCQNGRGGSTER